LLLLPKGEIDFTDPAKTRPCLRHVGRYVFVVLTTFFSISKVTCLIHQSSMSRVKTEIAG